MPLMLLVLAPAPNPAGPRPPVWEGQVYPGQIIVGIFFVLLAVAVIILLQRLREARSANTQTATNDGFFRNEIARTLLWLSVGGLVVLAALVITLEFAWPDGSATAKTVFDALLPVFGTWVGTLLAFYFSRANFEAAANIARGGSGSDRLRTLTAKDKMIPANQMPSLPDGFVGRTDDDIKLKELAAALSAGQRDRVAFFKGDVDNAASGAPKRVLHLSLVEKFIAQATVRTQPANIDDLKVATIAADPAFKPVIDNSFAVIPQTATLADAKTAMDKQSAAIGGIGNCYDVFVTATGKPDEVVIGWITNDIINESAKV